MGGVSPVQMGGISPVQIGGILQYKLEVYCGVSLSPKLRSQQGTALQMGGILRYKLEVYHQYFSDKLYGLGLPKQSPRSEVKKYTPKVFSALKTRVPQQGKKEVLVYTKKLVFEGKEGNYIYIYIYIDQRAFKVFVGDPFAQYKCIDFGLQIELLLPTSFGSTAGLKQ